MFMHTVGHVVIEESIKTYIKSLIVPAGTMFWDQGGVCGAIFIIFADVSVKSRPFWLA